MKKWWMLLLVALAIMGSACADTLVINGDTADRVHLRASPTETATSLGLYFTGTPVERLTTTSGGWSRVRIGSETGYVRTAYLTGNAAAEFVPCVVDNRTSDWVNLRAGASFEAEALVRLDNGTALQLMGETASGWSYVGWNGRRGYVVTDFLAAGQPAVTVSPSGMMARIVGTTADGGYIHALDADNGQTVYFVAMEAEPFITRVDVNFDGLDDLVVTTSRGATNCYYAFFVRTGNGYVRAEHPGVEGIANYALHPDKGYVSSHANAGNAGALYEDCLMRWEGSSLRLVRRAASREYREYRPEGNACVIVMHSRRAELTVYGYTADGESRLLHEEIIDLNGMGADKLNEMKQHLWTGLR